MCVIDCAQYQNYNHKKKNELKNSTNVVRKLIKQLQYFDEKIEHIWKYKSARVLGGKSPLSLNLKIAAFVSSLNLV